MVEERIAKVKGDEVRETEKHNIQLEILSVLKQIEINTKK